MKNKILTIVLVCVVLIVGVSGCTEQQETNKDTDNNQDFVSRETFSVNSTGGEFSLLQDSVEITVFSGCVSAPVNLTIETISNPVTDPFIHLLACYEFGPEGQKFERAIDLIIHYDISDLPVGLSELDLKVYVLNGSSWEPVNGSFVNSAMQYVVAHVTHFSKMGCGGPAPTNTNDGDDVDEEPEDDENTSSQYWFKANLDFQSFKDLRLNDWDDDTMYTSGVSAYWDPVPYVQYYEVKLVFHGNTPEAYAWGCDYRDQGDEICAESTGYYKDGFIFHLGGDPTLVGYLGQFDGSGEVSAGKYNETTGEMKIYVYGHIYPIGKHGFVLMSVHDTVEDFEDLSDYHKAVLESNMQTFVQQYVDKWEVWVRAVTETEG